MARRGLTLDVEALRALEEKRKPWQIEADRLRSERNANAKAVGMAKGKGEDAAALIAKGEALMEDLTKAEQALTAVQEELQQWQMGLPNCCTTPCLTVPTKRQTSRSAGGASPGSLISSPGITLRRREVGWPGFRGGGPDVGGAFRRHEVPGGAAASRPGPVHVGPAHPEHGYTEVYVPYLVQPQALLGPGNCRSLPRDLFAVKGEQSFYLIPTAEVPVTNLVREQIIAAEELPLKIVCHSPSFRSEAGAAGRDTRWHDPQPPVRQGGVGACRAAGGLLCRVGGADCECGNRVEATRDSPSDRRALRRRHGRNSTKTYDLEAWLPALGQYREISSCSNVEAFQARRMEARWRNPDTKKPEPVHTLNGSGLAVGRTLVAVLENYQNADGSVNVPQALISYMGGIAKLIPPVIR